MVTRAHLDRDWLECCTGEGELRNRIEAMLCSVLHTGHAPHFIIEHPIESESFSHGKVPRKDEKTAIRCALRRDRGMNDHGQHGPLETFEE